MAKEKKFQELTAKGPEENAMAEIKPQTGREALMEEQSMTNIKPSNPESEHIQRVMDAAIEQGSEKPPWVETYHWVKFQPRSNPNDLEKVQLTVNGECLLITRGVPVPLPLRFLENADHTEYPSYYQEPGELRKIATYVQTFAYEILRPATKEEFDRYREEGTRKMKEDLVKAGTMDRREAGL